MHGVRKFLALSLVPGLFVVSACGSNSSGSNSNGGGSAAPASGGQVQQLKDGVLDVFADGTYVPYEFLNKDGKTMNGMEVDMLNAISQKLGVKLSYHNMQFDGMIPAIANGRADLMIMGMSDTAARRKQVDFLDLYRTNYRIVTRQGNPANLTLGASAGGTGDTLNLCGHTAAVTTGGQQEQAVKVLNQNCAKAGKPEIKVEAFLQPTQEYLAVKNGRVDFNIMVPANANYFVKTTPGYQIIDGSFPNPSGKYTGWIVAKNATPLLDKLAAAINELIKDGTWHKILAKWGISQADAVVPPLHNGQPIE